MPKRIFLWLFAIALAFAPRAVFGTSLEDTLRDIAGEARTEYGFTGLSLAAVMADGEVVSAAVGYADSEHEIPLTPEGRMLAGSTGKVLFSAVALQLAGEGRLDLDAPISTWFGDEDWFPRLPGGPEITVRMLMNHSSGLANHVDDPEFLADFAAGRGKDPAFTISHEASVDYLLDKPSAVPPGEGFAYSDTNYMVLGLIVEKITGREFYDLIDERVLRPNSLKGIVPSNGMDIPGLVVGHWDADNNYFGIADDNNRREDGGLVYNPALEWAGGGFAATPTGLARLAKALYEEKIVTGPQFDQLMAMNPWAEAPVFTLSYGLGVIRVETEYGVAVGHSGFFPGYRTEMYYAPEERVAFVMMINSDTGANMMLVRAQLADRFMRAVGLREGEKTEN